MIVVAALSRVDGRSWQVSDVQLESLKEH